MSCRRRRVCGVCIVRRRETRVEGMLPEKLVRFVPEEWPGMSVRDRFRLWRGERMEFVRGLGGVSSVPDLWLDIVRGNHVESARLRRVDPRASTSP